MTASTPVFDWAPDLLSFVGRSARGVAITTFASLGLAVVYLLTATPHFTATSTVFVDMQAAEPFKTQTTPIDSQFASGIAESEAEVLQSEGLARVVVQRLGLANNAAFLANGNSLTGTVMGVLMAPFSTKMPETQTSRETAAAALLLQMIRVRRIGMSFILELGVVSRDPAISARLANALIDGFVESGLDAKGANTRRASAWMQQRIDELKRQAEAADQDVQAFKAKSGIIDTDKGLMSERHLGELNSQVVLARARVADARSKADRIHQIERTGSWAGDVSDAIQNQVITHLREQYVDAARQAQEWTAKVGPNHSAVLQMHDKMRDILTQIESELSRIANSSESDYQMAVANQADIEKQLAVLVTDGGTTNEKLVLLRGLQSTADTLKSLRDSFLQRYTLALQDQSFPISDVRVVSRAAEPLRKSWPKASIVLAGAAFVGLLLGFAVALLRDAFDHGLRTAAQVRAELGLPCLGMLPVLKMRRKSDREQTAVGVSTPPREIVAPSILRQTLLAPLSPYAEAIRGLRVRLTRTREGTRDVRVIGCVSALPGEGKSTVSANFAFHLAESGFRTLLVDCDLRKRTLSEALAPGCDSGLIELTAANQPLDHVLWRDAASGLAFLPASAGRPFAELPSLHGRGAQTLLSKLRGMFDFIVVDLPAILPVADAATVSNIVDGVVLVVEWAATPQNIVRESIEHAALDPERLLGVLLNKVDVDALRHYPIHAANHAHAPLVTA